MPLSLDPAKELKNGWFGFYENCTTMPMPHKVQ
jgi:hypothetical protein